MVVAMVVKSGEERLQNDLWTLWARYNTPRLGSGFIGHTYDVVGNGDLLIGKYRIRKGWGKYCGVYLIPTLLITSKFGIGGKTRE